MNFTLKVIENNRTIQRVQTHSLRSFTNSLRTINWLEPHLKVYLRVSYGEGYFNDGLYEKEKDLWLAFNAFKEKSLYAS